MENSSVSQFAAFSKMCLCVWANNVCEEFPLVLASNRDEALSRPTSTPVLDKREEAVHRDVLAGWDGRAGGTWIALNTRAGLLATLTNYGGEPTQDGQASRGAVATRLVSDEEIGTKLRTAVGNHSEESLALPDLIGSVDEYSGFNTAWAVVGRPNEPVPVWSSSNRHPENLDDSDKTTFHRAGIASLSNGYRSSRWDKMAYVEAGMASILSEVTGKPIGVNVPPSERGAYVPKDPGPIDGRFHTGAVVGHTGSGMPPERVAALALRLADMMTSDVPTLEDERARSWTGKIPGAGGLLKALANVYVGYDAFPPGGYGTRSQTIVIQDRSGAVHYFYRTTRPALERAWSYWAVEPLAPSSSPTTPATAAEQE